MIKDNLHKDKPKNILLLYGSKTEADIIFKKELDNIKEDWFKKVYFLSKENRSSELYEKGHINKTMIEKYVRDIDNNIFYICGPETMKNDVKKALINLGVKKRDIIIEDFFW
jgi:ring-1,2-phenylacetyl-CoA epoxidase subunit PaaE